MDELYLFTSDILSIFFFFGHYTTHLSIICSSRGELLELWKQWSWRTSGREEQLLIHAKRVWRKRRRMNCGWTIQRPSRRGGASVLYVEIRAPTPTYSASYSTSYAHHHTHTSARRHEASTALHLPILTQSHFNPTFLFLLFFFS